MRVLVAGEGPNELGSSASINAHAVYPGVVETLLRKSGVPIEQVTGVQWCSIHKYTRGQAGEAEARNVRWLALQAKSGGYDLLAFVRDRDGRTFAARKTQIDTAVAEVSEQPGTTRVVGGVAIECLESWMLAFKQRRRTEELSKVRAQAELIAAGVGEKDTAAMVELIEGTDLSALPDDATTLKAWLMSARTVADSAPGAP